MADAIDGTVIDTLKRTMEALDKTSKNTSVKVFDELIRKLDRAFVPLVNKMDNTDVVDAIKSLRPSESRDISKIIQSLSKLGPSSSSAPNAFTEFLTLSGKDAGELIRKLTSEGKVALDEFEIRAAGTRLQLKKALEAQQDLSSFEEKLTKLKAADRDGLNREQRSTLDDEIKQFQEKFDTATSLVDKLAEIRQSHIESEIDLDKERFKGRLAEAKLLEESYKKVESIRLAMAEDEAKTLKERIIEKFNLNKFNPIQTAIAGLGLAIDKLYKGLLSYKDKTFTSYTQSLADTKRLMTSMATNVALRGISVERTVDAAAGLTNFLGSAANYSTDMVVTSAKLSRYFGLSADEAASLIGNLKNSVQGSEKLSDDVIAFAGGLSNANRVPMGKTLKEMAKSGNQLSVMSKSMLNSFVEASVIAGKMGISISDIADKTKGMLDFESTLEKQNLASIMLGQQLNLMDVQRARNSRDMKGTLVALKEQIDKFDLTNMSEIQIGSLQSALGGMSEEVIRKIQTTSLSDIKMMSQEEAKKIYKGEEKANAALSVAELHYDVTKVIAKDVASILFALRLTGLKNLFSGAGGAATGATGGVATAGLGMGMLSKISTGGSWAGAAVPIVGGVGAGILGGMVANKAGMGRLGSALAGATAGALQGALYGGLPTGGAGALPGAVLGAVVGGVSGALMGGNSSPVAENGQAVSNVEYGNYKTGDVKTTVSDEIAPLVKELSAAIRSIPSSIVVKGDVELDGSKMGMFVINTMDKKVRLNSGVTNSGRVII